MMDTIVRGGRVVDGSGKPAVLADVALEDGRIVEVGRMPEPEGVLVLDATGFVVSPGFIDMHSHADLTLPICPGADSLVHQGITTAVVGQCGFSAAPLRNDANRLLWSSLREEEVPIPWDEWSSFESYLHFLLRTRIAVNVAPLIGQGMIRAAVMGYDPSPADSRQLARMRRELEEALQCGAFGLSTGLIYAPGSYASTDELVLLAQPLRRHGGLYFSHIRGEADTLLEAIQEAIVIGQQAGVGVELCHFKAASQRNWHKAAQGLEMIDQCRRQGLDVSADMYPYTAGHTSLVSRLPLSAQEGGKGPTLSRLADVTQRGKIREAMEDNALLRTEWDKVLISGCVKRPEYAGKSVPELAAEVSKEPSEWVFDALLETELGVDVTIFMSSEDNLRQQIAFPAMMVGTDAAALTVKGPLARGVPHPRSYGTFPRVLAQYVRDERVLTLEEAVWRMTGQPAQKLGLRSRGLLRKGYWADLVIFDPDKIADRGTYESPWKYPDGIRWVIVNGQIVVDHGVQRDTRPGTVLSRA